ncbi:hypothetical protein [[Scytonema hofmanni] UTEX B 1581]|nr:hypothetical protein [[Scytonema hofmanni] UTEX B 1581]
MPNAQCPMPNAQCPMPNAQCPSKTILSSTLVKNRINLYTKCLRLTQGMLQIGKRLPQEVN